MLAIEHGVRWLEIDHICEECMCGTRGEAQAIDEVAVYSVGQQLSLCCSSKKVKFC